MKIRKFKRFDYAFWILKTFKPNSIERNLADMPSACFESVLAGQMPVKHFYLDLRPIFYHEILNDVKLGKTPRKNEVASEFEVCSLL